MGGKKKDMSEEEWAEKTKAGFKPIRKKMKVKKAPKMGQKVKCRYTPGGKVYDAIVESISEKGICCKWLDGDTKNKCGKSVEKDFEGLEEDEVEVPVEGEEEVEGAMSPRRTT